MIVKKLTSVATGLNAATDVVTAGFNLGVAIVNGVKSIDAAINTNRQYMVTYYPMPLPPYYPAPCYPAPAPWYYQQPQLNQGTSYPELPCGEQFSVVPYNGNM